MLLEILVLFQGQKYAEERCLRQADTGADLFKGEGSLTVEAIQNL
jgi:hypothetical protein